MKTSRVAAILIVAVLLLLPAAITSAVVQPLQHAPQAWCVAGGDSHLQTLTLMLMNTLLPNSVVVSAGVVIFASQYTPAAVVAIDLTTGAKLWRVPTSQGRVFLTKAPNRDAVIYAASELGTVTVGSIELLTGRENWSLVLSGGMATPPVVNRSQVFADLGEAGIVAINAVNGEIRWQQISDARNGPLVLAGETTLIAGEQQRKVTALDAGTGETIWSSKLSELNGWAWTGASDGEVVVLTAWSGTPAITGAEIIAFSVETGIERWRFAMPGEFATSPTLVQGVVVVATGGGSVIAMDAETGQTLWQWKNDEPGITETFRGSALIVTDNVILVAGIQSIDQMISGVIHALDRRTGMEQWRISADGIFDTSAALAGDLVIAGNIGTAGVASVCAYPIPSFNFPFYPTGPRS